MYGSNYHGQAYYGQGPAIGTSYVLHTVSATVTSTAIIASLLLINHTVSATVTATASLLKQVNRTLSATVTATGVFTSLVVLALNLRRATTRSLIKATETFGLNFQKTTEGINFNKTTRDTVED
jgi:hypothetical protein